MNVTTLVRKGVALALSNRTDLRGRSTRDGNVSLLVVNYLNPADTKRLVASWRRFVSADGPVVVVENSGLPRPRAFDGRVRGLGVNLHHGLGLDFGLRFVTTEYVVICDPDSVVASADFWPVLRAKVDDHGAGGIHLGPAWHPICMGLRTELWKGNRVSMRPSWEQDRTWDVGGGLSYLLGGTPPESLLFRTRGYGHAIPSLFSGEHYPAEVYADVFSNTLGASRLAAGDAFGSEEGDPADIGRVHAVWRAWADGVAYGDLTVSDFPVNDPVARPQRLV